MKITFELLQKIINTIDLGIVFVDTDNKIVIFNNTAGDMLNADPEEKIG
ncbi:PAS domain-containing protein, partial [Candidatus Bathyarchaeota archaeon]|nr:PAS domain-containing protein [Candidatus Bathyarchaeota archaeon]